ncbi:MAG: SLC13 family permease [Pyrinomonadaceae bacterium]|nr:SLC13 family permease [Pyrinomonadaceae bacterium]
MDNSLLITLAILASALIAFLTDRIPADIVALLVAVALGLTGVLTTEEAFSGFSQAAVIIIIAIFILAEGLKRTGVTEKVSTLLLKVGGRDEARLTVAVMAFGSFLSLFMNSIAAAAVLMPAVSGAAKRADIRSSRILMPLALSTIVGGAATLFTTSNIILSTLLVNSGAAGFSIVDFMWVGLPAVIASIAYMAFFGRTLLHGESMLERTQTPTRSERDDLVAAYGLGQSLFRAKVPENSFLIDRPLMESTLREKFGVSVVAIERDGRKMLSLSPTTEIRRGDILVFEGEENDFRKRDVEPLMELLPTEEWEDEDLESRQVEIVEAMIAPRSRLIGESLRGVDFREKFGLNVLAIWRRDREIVTNLAEETLQFGDALLLQGTKERLQIAARDPDLIVLMSRDTPVEASPAKGRTALIVFAASIILALAFPSILGPVMLGGALVMILTGVLSTDQAYSSIGWRSVFIIAGMLPMGIALVKTNAAGLVGDHIGSTFGSYGPLVMMAGLVAITMMLVQVMNSAVVATIMGPIAIQIAHQSGFDPRAMVMSVAIAASMAFVTPLGHPVNVLVMGPAGYGFKDFVRVGLPLAGLLFLVVMAFLWLFWL